MALKDGVTKKSLLISMIIVLSIGLFVWGSIGFVEKDTADDIAKIKHVILKSVEMSQSLPQLPEAYSSTTNTEIPDKVKKMMYDKITSSLTEIYSAKSPILTNRINVLQGAIDAQSKEKFRSQGGGIRKFENFQVNINGDEATAEIDIRTWAKLIDDKGKAFTPENTAHYLFTLVKEDKQWKITGEEFKFLPGEEP